MFFQLSWRLSSLRTRLQLLLQGVEATRPSVMLYTAHELCIKEETNGNKNKSLIGNNHHNSLSSHFCSNNNLAMLGDLLWFQGDKRLCIIYPQQKVDVTNWLLYPHGKTIFPLFAHNNAQISLLQNEKMHVLIEADLNNYIPHAFSKATKLEDYGLIVSWTLDNVFAVILETDLDHITKFSTTLMQGQCFINNGLPVTRIESVSVSGKPCVCNYERFNAVESKKLMGGSQWKAYINKLKLVSSTARQVSQQNISIEVKEISGLVISPGSQPIILQMPTILEIAASSNSSVPSTPPPTPASASAIMNRTEPKLSQIIANSNIELNPLVNLSMSSLTNLSSGRSQEYILESSQENLLGTPIKSVRHLKKLDRDTRISSLASSVSSLSNVNYSPLKKTDSTKNVKPPSILIYADSAVASDNVHSVLQTILKENKYTIYALSTQQAKQDIWMDQASLVIVCGNVGSDIASQVVEYLTHGGKLLALCSDILKSLLPTFKTAEVRENELVRFSYGKWKHVRMMHHVFCYQASPVKTKFSQDVDESRTATPPTPVSASITDSSGKTHAIEVKVLGSEETWHTPSILLANLVETGGKALFSQIHLEADPSQYEFEESKFNALKESNVTRLEIFTDLISTHMGLDVNPKPKIPPTYTSAFFLGRHELKLEMLKKLKSKMQPNDILKTTKLEIQFCNNLTDAKPASSTFLPVIVHRCPENFNTVEYFENLNTEAIGRLVIYSDVMTTSYDVTDNLVLQHGLAVIPRHQTHGRGRTNNTWLSPDGCAMFTLQLHIPTNSILGERISLIQHLTSVAIVSAVKSIPGYESINLRIKWPNDIYTEDNCKVGGLIVKCNHQTSFIICNIGTGINVSNSSPTVCLNDLIKKHNGTVMKKLKKLTVERFLSAVFNEIEHLLNTVQDGNLDHLYNLYYQYWMHTDADITIIQSDGSSQQVKIIGIDNFGFLEVKGKRGNVFSVHPDGNSFDILKGLIAPKLEIL
ncbi:biotin--protein ligase isoform X2 [Phymastichus coffea]|uniref:biotin--protein ligase isoform X2 n=1 Tax=Phymastichus coffea TaxID=108790 RepID=UPI00273C645D|nr:biotin--protein ligase isoform X2 [Phymastichus coffea]